MSPRTANHPGRSGTQPEPATALFWKDLVRPLLDRYATPFYLFSVTPLQAALDELDQHFGCLPVRHWYSFKTQPLRPLVRWWRQQNRPIEVVSEFELLAARREGFPPDSILVNGPAKHRWLPRHPLPGLRVNFDSAAEIQALLPLALRLRWRLGLRLQTREEHDPETPAFPTQFGFTPEEAHPWLRRLARGKARLETLHFHLRTHVASPSIYERALGEVSAFCHSTGFTPRHVDCGGGFPPPQVRRKTGEPADQDFRLADMRQVLERAQRLFPPQTEFWMENGRWLTARSGVLVVRVLDVKERRGLRHLICDGGRTGQALVSTWEDHPLLLLPERRGRPVLTALTGPTCMAFDQMARRPLPRSLRADDVVVWMEAGAYHLSWETRFSHGLARILWHDGRRTTSVRAPESFDAWWGAS